MAGLADWFTCSELNAHGGVPEAETFPARISMPEFWQLKAEEIVLSAIARQSDFI